MTYYVNQLKKLAGVMGLKLQGYDTKTFRGNYRKKFYLIERDDKNPIVYLFADPGGNKIYSGLAIPLNLKYNLQLSISPEFLPGCLSLFRSNAKKRIKAGDRILDQKYAFVSDHPDIMLRILNDEALKSVLLHQFPVELKFESNPAYFDQTPFEGKSGLSLLFLDGWKIDKEILLDAKRILLTACEYLLHRRFVNP